MRKTLVPLSLLALLILGLVFALRTSDTPSTTATEPATTNDGKSSPETNRLTDAPTFTGAWIGSTSTTEAPPVVTTQPELFRTFDLINEASESDTTDSLALLIRYGTSSNEDVRGAALDALIRRDDATAVPLLRQAAKQVEESAVIIDLLKTAEYLNMPAATFTEIRARQKTRPDDAGGSASPRSSPRGPAPATTSDR